MRIIVPPITRPIPLTDYAPELVRDDGAPVTVWAWVNPPARLIREMLALQERSRVVREQLAAGVQDGAEIADIADAVAAWYAAIWSQHTDPATHWTAAEVRELTASETDPGLDAWLKSRTWDAIAEHRTAQKKA